MNNYQSNAGHANYPESGEGSVRLSHGVNPNDFNQLRNDPHYSLTNGERSLMRMHLEEISRGEAAFAAPVESSWFVFLMRPMPLAALALILIISTSSVSFAAGGALPGEALYGVKVRVNEKVELALAPSLEAKANVRVRQAEERLRETEVLAVRGDLSEEIAETAALAVKENVEAAVSAALALEDEGDLSAADSIHTRIASALSVHSELLDAQSENFSDEPRETLRTLAVAVQETAADAYSEVPMGDDDSDEAGVKAGAESAFARAKDRVEAFGERLEDNGISNESESEFLNELARLTTELEATEEYVQDKDYAAASLAWKDIDRRAYRALALLRSAQAISDETDQEVVVVLAASEPAAMMDASSMTRSKMSAEPEVATMSLMVEATTSALAGDAVLFDPLAEAATIRTSARLEFWLRTEEKE